MRTREGSRVRCAAGVLRTGWLMATLLGVWMVAGAAPALAVRGHSYTSFGGEGSEPGQFLEPRGVAVNDDTGEVYVSDTGNGRVERFSGTGAFSVQFNGASAPTGPLSSPTGVAVDNSTDPLDPSTGDVYVIDAGHDVIDKFSPGGVYEGQITEGSGSAPLGELDGVAVDATGNVWVYQASGEIDEYANGLSNTFISSRQSPFGVQPGFAVDAQDDLYVLRGSGQFGKLDSAGEVLIETFDGSESSTGAAVDFESGNVYIEEGPTVGVFAPSGTLLERFGSGKLGAGAGIAVAPREGAVYVAEPSADEILIAKPEVVAAPQIGPAYAQNVTSSAAVVYAGVDPHGSDTTYLFQYGTADCATPPTSCLDVPSEPGSDIGEGFGEQTVDAQLSGLVPGTTYHYRVVARNDFGEVKGHEHEFTTQREGRQTSSLPDDRVWEMVSPPEKNSGHIEPLQTESGDVQASAAGGAFAYLSDYSTSAEPAGEANLTQLLATRTAEGWKTQDLATPHQAPTTESIGAGQEYRMFSTELSASIVAPFELGGGLLLSHEASERTVYIRNEAPPCEAAATGCFHPLVTSELGYSNVPPGVEFGGSPTATRLGVEFLNATPELGAAVLASNAQLTEQAATGEGATSLFEWKAGSLALASVLPDKTAADAAPAQANAFLGRDDHDVRHALSADGSRIVWETQQSGEEPRLYLRDMQLGETVQIDKPQAPATGIGRNEPVFQTADAQDTKIFFTDEAALTVGSTASEGNPDLYVYEVSDEAGKLAGRLEDLTAEVLNGGESAAVQGAVIGAAEDGSTVYFVADGVLAAGATPGDCGPTHENNTSPVTCDLYESHEIAPKTWTTTFIATLSGGDRNDWAGAEPENLHFMTAQVSPHGAYLEFMSEQSLTGYDNHDARSGEPDEEVFLYNSSSHRLICASCNPTGARPSGIQHTEQANLLVDPISDPTWSLPGTDSWVAASVPGWTAVDSSSAIYQSRYLDDTGRLFFDSQDSLVPADTNGKEDVYEFEPEGVGTCVAASSTFDSSTGGCVNLISSGTSPEESAFLDASASGDDVFFLTSAKLAPQDLDEAADIYDAHVCEPGSQCPSAASVATEQQLCASSEACQGATVPPAPPAAAPSASSSGEGNVQMTQVKPKSKPQTRAQMLAEALRSCRRRRSRKRRAGCEREARHRYSAKRASSKAHTRSSLRVPARRGA